MESSTNENNHTSVDDGSVTSYTANSPNQYSDVGNDTYAYDLNGNLTDDGTYAFDYDCLNRLLLIEKGIKTIGEYSYDHSGRRISKTIYAPSAVVTKYAYDGAQVIAEYDGTDTLLRKFIYG